MTFSPTARLKCRATADCAFFFVYTTGRSAGHCFPKSAVLPGKPAAPSCKPPHCHSAFYKMDGRPTVPPPPPPPPPGKGEEFGDWTVPKIVERGVTAHQLYSQITWRFHWPSMSLSLLHIPLPSGGVSTGMERGCQQNDILADG